LTASARTFCHSWQAISAVSTDSCLEDSMIPTPYRPVRLAVALGLALAALMPAAGADPAKPADPADPQAKVPELRYAGSLARYRALQEAPVASWQAVNENTTRAGGWRAYAREKDAEPSPPPKTEPAAKKPAADKRHGQHQGHHQGHHHGPR
jgi:hypothetical protein